MTARTSSGPKDQSARLLLITVPGGIEDYFRQINNAPDDEEGCAGEGSQ